MERKRFVSFLMSFILLTSIVQPAVCADALEYSIAKAVVQTKTAVQTKAAVEKKAADVGVLAESTDENGFVYEVIDGAFVSIVDYVGESCNVEIPVQIDELPVKMIGDKAFLQTDGLETVKIPETVETIGRFAFADNAGLKTVTVDENNTFFADADGVLFDKTMKTLICYPCGMGADYTVPDGVEALADGAFSGSTVKNIILPESLKQIGEMAFYNCSNIGILKIPDSVEFIGEDAFGGCENITLLLSKDSYAQIYALKNKIAVINGMNDEYMYTICDDGTAELKKYLGDVAAEMALPEKIDGFTVSRIGNALFADAKTLKAVTVPEGVKCISTKAFASCSALVSVSLPKSLEEIGNSAFYGCVALGGAELPENLKIIGAYSFYNCDALKNIAVPNSLVSIGEKAFYACELLQSVSFGEGIKTIRESAFARCPALTEIIIPDSVTEIGKGAFEYCTALKNVVIGNGVLSMGSNAFAYSAVENVTINDAAAGIGEGAFSYCYSLKNVSMGKNVTSIGKNAFVHCSVLGDIVIGESVTEIGASAFSKCVSLQSVVFPDSLKTINQYAFASCARLTELEIPNGVTKIDSYAFKNCLAIKEIKIGTALSEIGDAPFGGCNALQNIFVAQQNENYCDIDGVLFDKVKETLINYPNAKGGSYTVPVGTLHIGGYAFASCAYLTNVVLASGVTSIAANAFDSCTMLKSVYIPPTVTAIEVGAFNNCTALTVYGESGSYAQSYTTRYRIPFLAESAPTATVKPTETPVVTPMVNGDFEYEILNGTSVVITAYKGNGGAVDIPNEIEGLPVEVIGQAAFSTNSSITSVTIPDSVTDIEFLAFWNCPLLQEVKLGKNVASVGESAFAECAKLKSVTGGENLKVIGKSAFSMCFALDSFTIPESVEKIDEYGLYYSALESVTVPENTKTIGRSAFGSSPNLTSVKILASDAVIGRYVFTDCSADLVLYGYADSTAQEYAQANKIKFVLLDPETEKPTEMPNETPVPTANPSAAPSEPPVETQPPENAEQSITLKDDSGYTLDSENGVLSGVSVRTTLAQLLAKLENSESIIVRNASGKLMSDENETVGTGCVLSKFDDEGNMTDSVTVVVSGDANGDAAVNSRDVAALQKHITDIAKMNGAFLLAADLNRDSAVNSRDIASVQKIILN